MVKALCPYGGGGGVCIVLLPPALFGTARPALLGPARPTLLGPARPALLGPAQPSPARHQVAPSRQTAWVGGGGDITHMILRIKRLNVYVD